MRDLRMQESAALESEQGTCPLEPVLENDAEEKAKFDEAYEACQ